MTEQRTATEVLLSLEQEVKDIKAYLGNLDNNIKVLLARFNQTMLETKPTVSVTPTAVAPILPPKTFDDLKNTNRFEQALAQVGITDEPDDSLVEAAANVGQRRGQRVETQPGKRVNVSQETLLESGTPLYLAVVEISDSNGNVVMQRRTNNKGVWNASLEPGTYSINISKRDGGSKKPIELRYDIVVPAQKALILEPCRI